MVSVRDQVVLIVGASSGVGRTTAVLFAREGANVVASARREERLRSLERELAKEKRSIMIRPADARNADEMKALAQATLERFGKIDILVYTTGTNIPDRSMERLNAGLWDEMIDVNLNGAFYITHAVLPAMRAAGSGHLIYVSSMAALQPDLSGAAYQASKRGLLGMAHAIRLEEGKNGIRTCVVCPGLINTELVEKRPQKTAPETLAKALQPDDVAEMIVYVAKVPARAAVPEVHLIPALL